MSILLTTYNHEAFVREALDGFLAQETTFPVEIVVHDDASTDDTVAVLRQYANAHPRLFHVIAQTENQHSRGNRAVAIMMASANGEYVALCDGDDYWTHSDKLETQVRLLDGRPDASGSIHRADARFEENDELLPGFFGPEEKKLEYGVDDLLVRDNFVPTASIVLRRNACDLPPWLGEVPHGDIVILCNAALTGPLLYIDRSMAVYRKHSAGIHSRDATAVQALKCVQTLVVLGKELGLANRASFRSGVYYRLSQIDSEVQRYETSIRTLSSAHEDDRREMQRIMASTTFRVGLKFRRLQQRLIALYGRYGKAARLS